MCKVECFYLLLYNEFRNSNLISEEADKFQQGIQPVGKMYVIKVIHLTLLFVLFA